MRILHLGKYYAPFEGGIENTMRGLMTLQNASDHQVSAIVHQHKVEDVETCELDGDMAIYRMSIQGILMFVPIALFAYFVIRKAIAKERPDVLHLHMPNVSCFWLLLMPIARKIPWIIHWHSDVIGERPDARIKMLYPLYRIFEQWLLRRANTVIVTSPNYLVTSVPLQAWHNKCEIVPLGIKCGKESDSVTVSEMALPHGELNVLCIGRLTYYKGHEYLIDAIAKVRQSGVDIHLDLVGNGELKPVLEHQIASLNLAQSVTLHGALPRKKLTQLIHKTQVVCLPSIERTEAFGLVLLEAMHAKKPCIVTDVKGSGMSFVVDHLSTGLVVQHSNAQALADAITHCAHYPHHLLEWGDSGYNKVVAEFSMQQVADKIEMIYQKALTRV